MFFRWLWLYLWEWSGVCPLLVLGPRDHGSLRQLHPDVRSCPRNLCVAVFTAPVSSPGFGEYKLPTLPGVQYLLLYIKMLVSNFFPPSITSNKISKSYLFFFSIFHFTCHPWLPMGRADVEEDIDIHHNKYSDVDFFVDDTDIGISSPVVPSTFSSSHDCQI